MYLLALVGAAACSNPVVDADEAVDGGSTTQGIVLVERIATADGAPQTNVSAKFMRMAASADSELAERVVGSRLNLPAVGTCAAQPPAGAASEAPPSLSSLGSIELLDVGDLTLRTGDATMPLAARAFPDVGELVSGVFYTSRDATSDLPAAATYVLQGTGAGPVDRFSIEASAPAGPEDVRVGDAALADGVALLAGESAVVHWRSESAGRDTIYIDVGSALSGAVVRCAFEDSGQATIPAAFVQPAILGAFPAGGTFAVHRVRLGSFGASGIDVGEVRFDFAAIGRAVLRDH